MKNYNLLIKKLMSLLNDFSDQELRQLKLLMQEERTNITIINIINNIFSLRNISEDNKLNGQKENKKNSYSLMEAESTSDSTVLSTKGRGDELKNHIIKILNNKKLFPKTVDVIDAVNLYFSFNLHYEDYLKRGRRDLINKFIKLVNGLPENERKERFRIFFNNISEVYSEKDSYRQLFKILIGDES